jgi:hypothetical protein
LTIDSKTGLAQLPDDLFWRVEKDNRTSYDGRKKTEHKGLRLKLIRKSTETVEGECVEYEKKVRRSGFWSRLFLGETTTEKVIEVTPTTTEETEEEIYALSTFHSYSTLEDTGTHEVKEGFLFWYRDHWSNRNYYIKPGPVTAEALIDLSKEVLTSWINKQYDEALAEDKARYRDAFLGDYPPKTLVGAGV